MNDATVLEHLLAKWVDCEGLESVADFIARHPEHDGLLRKHFALHDVVDRAFAPRPTLPETLGPFRIEKELGSGGMGSVYRAVVAEPVRGIATGRTVALKVVHPHLFRTQGFFKRFLREAELGQRIDHPNVVRTLDADAVEIDDRPQHYLVMEYVEGQTLRDLVEDVDRVPEELARHVGCEVAKALSAIHAAGAVHRDLKPENVLITPDHQIKVMDLGVARLADEQVRLSQTGAFVGSLHYAAPEQFGGGANVDFRADLHGLGVLLYEIATGTNPYADEDARVVMRRILSETPRKAGELNTQLSPFFEELLVQLLAKEPAQRFDAAEDVLAILENAEQSEWWSSRAKALRVGSGRPLRRIRVPRETAVYGRDGELARVRDVFASVRGGAGQVMLVEGEAGIGKTRLVDEFVSQLQQDGEDVNFLFASHPPGGAATAVGAFSAAYREQIGADEAEAALADLLADTPSLVPAFAAVLRGEVTPHSAQPLTKDSLQTCFVHVTQQLAVARTTIVLIDDLHFAPREGRALFSALALATPGHRILLIGTMRPGVPEDWIASLTRLEHTTHMTVPRLGPKDLVRLLGETFKSERLAEELGGRIGAKSDGNPFFAFEIIRGLREGQFIRQRDDGSWETTRLIEDIQVPSSVLDLVNARVAELDADERNLLDVAACWGFEFDPSLIADAAEVARVPALRRLAQVEKKHRLVRSVGRRMAFDHHQVQEALYGALPEMLREEYHAALGETLEARAGDAAKKPTELDGSMCVEICSHLLRGSRSGSAARYVSPTLAHLDRNYEYARMVEIGAHALSTPDLLTGFPRVVVQSLLARATDRTGQTDRKEVYCEGALKGALELGDARATAIARGNLACVRATQGRLDDAREGFEFMRDWAISAGDRRAEAFTLEHLANIHGLRGRRDEGLKLLQRALSVAVECQDAAFEARCLDALCGSYLEQGNYDAAVEYAGRALATARGAGPGALDAEAAANARLASLHAAHGRHDLAMSLFNRTKQMFVRVGRREGAMIQVAQVGCLLRDVGRFTEARQHLRSAIDTFDAMGLPRRANGHRAELGVLEESAGRLAEAHDLMSYGVAGEREAGVLGHVAEFLVPLSRVEWTLGRPDRARAHAAEALAIANRVGIPRVTCLALAQQALWGTGDVAAAEEALQGAEHLVPLTQRILVRHTLWKAGDDDRHLLLAKELLDALVDGAIETAHESMLEVVPLYRDVIEDWRRRFGSPPGNEVATGAR